MTRFRGANSISAVFMCGIIGFVGEVAEGRWAETHAILERLFLESEHRGRDATGFAARITPRRNPQRATSSLAKRPIPAREFVGSDEFRRLGRRRCTAFLGHVRAATHGHPADPRNNHPFASRDGELFLVHNGILSNHLDVADALNLRLESDCDSEVLLRIIETADDIPRGLALCHRELKGSMAIAVLEGSTGTVWLSRNEGRPLWLGRLRNDRRWFFASTDQILRDAIEDAMPEAQFDFCAPIPEETSLRIGFEGDLLGVPLRRVF